VAELTTSSKPPRRRAPRVGQVWHVQKTKGNPLLTVHVDELTRKTVMLRVLPDGSVQPRPGMDVLRWLRADFTFVERVK
jgi:hypothetical protein